MNGLLTVICGTLLVSVAARADLIVRMDLDLTCTEAQGDLFPGKEVRILSNGAKTEVTFGGKTFAGPAMRGGTEDSEFFSDYFDRANNLKISFTGGDIAKLGVRTASILNATTPAEFSHGQDHRQLSCKGRLGYLER